MANLAATLAAFFFLFAFCHARIPLDRPVSDLLTENGLPITTVPESDSKATILLPSEKPDSEQVTVIELEPEITETKPQESDTSSIQSMVSQEPDTNTVAAVGLTRPFTVVNLHPINRHFRHMPTKQMFPFRLPHRCHHHHKQGGPRFNTREISYGNDMILSAGKEVISDPAIRSGGVREIPATWVRVHHHGRPGFGFPRRHRGWNVDDAKRPHHHGEEKEHKEEKEEGSFMMRFRKFLNQF